MNTFRFKIAARDRRPGFTLVEMLVVIAIMSILMTAGAIGLGGMGGKGVTSGVATVESLFDEARNIAVSQRTKSRVLIARTMTNAPSDNLRRVVILVEKPATTPGGPPTWELSSRGALLPDQVFYSQEYSTDNHGLGGGPLPTMTHTQFEQNGSPVKATYNGDYFYYEFNAAGICTTPGASVVIGTGARSMSAPNARPKVTSAARTDFGGFVIWKNGRTSLFRSPEQISASIRNLTTGSEF